MKNQKNTEKVLCPHLVLNSDDGQMQILDYDRNLRPLLKILDRCNTQLRYSFTIPAEYTTNKDVSEWELKCTREIEEHNKKFKPTVVGPYANFIDSLGQVVYVSYYPHEPHAEWTVRVMCRLEFRNMPDEIYPSSIGRWKKQCEHTRDTINKRAVKEMDELSRRPRNTHQDRPEKAKSDVLKLGLVMIPFYSIYRIGKIFIEGLRYGRDNWKKGIYDTGWQEERLEHAINHLFLYKEGNRSEDHLAKVAWFCVVQMELIRLEEEGLKNDEPVCSSTETTEYTRGPESVWETNLKEPDLESLQKAINESYAKARIGSPVALEKATCPLPEVIIDPSLPENGWMLKGPQGACVGVASQPVEKGQPVSIKAHGGPVQTRSLEEVYEKLQHAIQKIDELSKQNLPTIF